MIEQRSEEWFLERLGCATASRISDIVAKTKTGYSASRANYMAQLIVETLTGKPQESYTNAAMQWGTETEPQARASYSFFTGHDVQEVGFVRHPTIEKSGASPDGLVGDDGLLEIKCPNTATHIDFLLGGTIDKKYLLQMQWQMICTGRKWCDFVSFDPRLPIDLQMKVVRVVIFAKSEIESIEEEVKDFLFELEEKIEKLRNMCD